MFQDQYPFKYQVRDLHLIYIIRTRFVSKYRIYGRGLVANDIIVLPLNALMN
jgi:hypothetical protein